MVADQQEQQPHWIQIETLAERWARETGADRQELEQDIVQWFASYLIETAPEDLEAGMAAKGQRPAVDSKRHLSRELCAEFCRSTDRALPAFWFGGAAVQKEGPFGGGEESDPDTSKAQPHSPRVSRWPEGTCKSGHRSPSAPGEPFDCPGIVLRRRGHFFDLQLGRKPRCGKMPGKAKKGRR